MEIIFIFHEFLLLIFSFKPSPFSAIAWRSRIGGLRLAVLYITLTIHIENTWVNMEYSKFVSIESKSVIPPTCNFRF